MRRLQASSDLPQSDRDSLKILLEILFRISPRDSNSELHTRRQTIWDWSNLALLPSPNVCPRWKTFELCTLRNAEEWLSERGSSETCWSWMYPVDTPGRLIRKRSSLALFRSYIMAPLRGAFDSKLRCDSFFKNVHHFTEMISVIKRHADLNISTGMQELLKSWPFTRSESNGRLMEFGCKSHTNRA